MARGGSARVRRTARRAAERSAAQGVDKAQDRATVVEITDDERAAFAALYVSTTPTTSMDQFEQALVAAGVEADPSPQTTYELTRGSLAERAFLSAAIATGYSERRTAQWPCEGDLADVGEVLFREGNAGVFRLDDGTIVSAHLGHGWFAIDMYAPTRAASAATVQAFSAAYPPLYREESEDSTTVPITFWNNSAYGPSSRLRMIDAATWDDIEGNYTAEVRDELSRLMGDFTPGQDGQLLLWQGSPGTGKTWALRALASEWRDWAEFNYITDPDSFFVGDPSYMVNVLLSSSYEELTPDGDVVTEQDKGGKWRVLILEDTGELLSANAKESYGQGLSRLLNVVDGLVGQGLRVLALVTTNDELGDLHPATTRPGRCASQIEFGPLSEDEASAWLSARIVDGNTDVEVEGPKSLAELYEIAGDAVEALADDGEREPMSGPCSCGHMAAAHEGDMNDGECSTCECQQFEPADSPDDTTSAEAVEFVNEHLAGQTRGSWSLDPDAGWMTVTGGEAGNDSNTVPAGSTLMRLNLHEFTLVSDATLPVEMTPGETVPATRPDPELVPPTEMPMTGVVRWEAVLCPEGAPTDDGRIFAPGSITWRELPLSLMGMIETQEGHDGAVVCGRIDRIWRDEAAGVVRGAGEFDTGEFGADIARLVDDRTLRGVSVDIAVSKMEVVPRSEILDEDGNWIESQQVDEEPPEEPSLLDILFGGDGEDMLFVVREGVIGAATVCPFPAFADATIEVASSLTASVQSPMVWTVTADGGYHLSAGRVSPGEGTDGPEGAETQDTASLTASAAGIAPECPPAEWFAPPEFDGLTAVTVTDDGHIYGHAASWDTCHIGFPGICVTAPLSHSDYAYFHLKEIVCDDGSRISCGTITLDTGHADRDLGRSDASRHYDDTGTAVADVIVGEDDYGIWFTGALRGDVDADLARKTAGSVLSGDWRDVNGDLELVALLAVNVPGFPVPRTRAVVASAADGPHVTALIAAGLHIGQGPEGVKGPTGDPTGHPGVTGPPGLTALEIEQFKAIGVKSAGGFSGLIVEKS